MTFDKIPGAVAVATFIAICLVVSHEWAYFSIIGAEFQSLFTTYDYLTQFIIWIGPAFIVLIVAIAVQGALLRSADFQQQPVAESKWGKRIENWYLEILQAISLVFALLFSDETKRISFYTLASLLWVRIASYILSYKGLQDFAELAVE